VKILIVGINFYPELTGIGKYTGELAAYLAGQGHGVHVITTPPYYPHWQMQDGYHEWQYRKEAWQGVEIQRCPLWVPHRPTGFTRLVHLATFAFSSLPALVAQLSWKPALVLCIAPALMNAPFVLAFARLTGAQAWLHIQDFELEAAAGLKMLPAHSILFPLAQAFERFTLSHFAHVSTISENMRRLCLERGAGPERTFLLPNWVDTKRIYPVLPPGALRARLHIPPQSFVALYHGSMGRKQGLTLLLEAALLLQLQPGIILILCGEGSVKQQLMESAASLPNVRFMDLQPEEKLNELVNLADVHVLPQLANAADLVMPSKLTSMLASGRPVIACSDPGTQISKILETIGLVVPPENAAALAQALICLYENPIERQRLGSLGRAYACQHLDKDIILSCLSSFPWLGQSPPESKTLSA
jgi:colanic acid biosynthesis glycosyl transferase WcaI